MSQASDIEWTDSTWNPVRGCTKVSPGCAHCYAETFAERWRGIPSHPYEQGFDLRLVPEKLNEPLSWKKPRRVFVNSMSDLFQDGVPDAFIAKVFGIMAQSPRHTFQVLTKRADRMHAIVPTLAAQHTAPDGSGWPLPNVWLGVSVENQHFADERIPLLLATPAAVRFISAEPLLGPVTFRWSKWDTWRDASGSRREVVSQLDGLRMLDWVIVGGESGPDARPFNIAWARSIVQQCQSAGVAVFVKQLGANPVDALGTMRHPVAGQIPIANRKGGEPSEWPEDLRVREFPR